MINFFATQKPFNQSKLIRISQENAILSWLHLPIEKEITLLGDDEGVAEFAGRWGLKYVRDIKKNTHGYFLIDDLLAVGEAQSSYRIKCFINSDIILTDEFADLVRFCNETLEKFVCIGSQFDIDLNKKIDFNRDWKSELLKLRKQWRGIAAKDYFLYSDSLPPTKKSFGVGLPGWDCWVLQRALETDDLEVIDCSAVPTFHQNHDYRLAGKTYNDCKWWKEKGIKGIQEEYFKDNWRKSSTKVRECKKILRRTPTRGFKLVDNPFSGIEKLKVEIFDKDKDAYLKNIIEVFLEICKKKKLKVIVYGAGSHTKTLFSTTGLAWADIAGIGDKYPKGKYFLDYRVFSLEELKESKAHVVLISSKPFQGQMESDIYRIYGNNFYYFTCYP